MKLFLLLLPVFMLSVNGLSPDEQKKLLDAVNEDRQELGKKLNLSMPPLSYNSSLERDVEAVDHWWPLRVTYLKWNDVAEILRIAAGNDGQLPSVRLFIPKSYTIGCSKTHTISFKIDKLLPKIPASLLGKTAEYYGGCMISWDGYVSELDEKWAELKKIGLPSPSKYADIIGMKASK